MVTPQSQYEPPSLHKKTLWQRYITSSKQQKIVLPIGIVILATLITKIFAMAAVDIQAAMATETPRPTFTATLTLTLPPTLTSTITLTPTITDTPTITFTPTLTFTPTKTNTPTVTMTPTLTLPAAAGAECVPPGSERVLARVVRITDGDTIVVNIDGVEYKLRYIGIDAPESNAAGGSLSTAQNRYLVEGKKVILVKDVSEKDKYDRLLRYVFVGNLFVNYEMVHSGFATSGSWSPDTSCDQSHAAAMAYAKNNKLGLWAPTPTPKPYVPVPLILQPTKVPAGNCDPSYPTVCIPPPPPDLDCKDISFKKFQVLPPDPHNFDADHDGIGCES